MTDCNAEDKSKNQIGRKSIMQTPLSTPKRGLRKYRDVVGSIRYQRSRKHPTLREAGNQADAGTDLRYYLTALPKNASQNEKRRLLEELADAIGNIDTSDVFLISLWIGE
jgi:hypothetical protein